MEKLRRFLAAEKEQSDKAWQGYRDTLYELVEVKIKLESIEAVLRGER
jgi:hypothetical protein